MKMLWHISLVSTLVLTTHAGDATTEDPMRLWMKINTLKTENQKLKIEMLEMRVDALDGKTASVSQKTNIDALADKEGYVGSRVINAMIDHPVKTYFGMIGVMIAWAYLYRKMHPCSIVCIKNIKNGQVYYIDADVNKGPLESLSDLMITKKFVVTLQWVTVKQRNRLLKKSTMNKADKDAIDMYCLTKLSLLTSL